MLDRFAGPEWHEMMQPYLAGNYSHFEHMQKLYNRLPYPAEELLDYARSVTEIRPGFDKLVQLCRERDWPFAVVSGGIDFYLKAFLDKNIHFYCYLGEFDTQWRLRLPDWPSIDMESGQDFKVQVIEGLQQQNPGEVVVFIGDGKNDLEAARHADYVFSVAGSRLSELSRKANLPHTEFNSFAQVVTGLEKIQKSNTSNE